MLLEELRTGDDSQKPQLEQAGQNFKRMRQEVDQELETLFQTYDGAPPESESARQALHEIRGVLNRRRYIENLIRDVDRALNPTLQPAEPEL